MIANLRMELFEALQVMLLTTVVPAVPHLEAGRLCAAAGDGPEPAAHHQQAEQEVCVAGEGEQEPRQHPRTPAQLQHPRFRASQ